MVGTSVGYHVGGPHFMNGLALPGALLTPFNRCQPHRSELAINFIRDVLVVFHGSANDNGGSGHQWPVAEKTNPLHAIIDKTRVELSRSAMGGHHCDQTFTAVPGIVSFFLLIDHPCFLCSKWRLPDLRVAETLLVERQEKDRGRGEQAIA